jgi:hypothetical protein
VSESTRSSGQPDDPAPAPQAPANPRKPPVRAQLPETGTAADALSVSAPAPPEPAPPEPAPVPDPFYGWIGQGSAGTDASVPECPVCLAVDGGAHGGGCPNTDKDPADWVNDPPAGWIAPGR